MELAVDYDASPLWRMISISAPKRPKLQALRNRCLLKLCRLSELLYLLGMDKKAFKKVKLKEVHLASYKWSKRQAYTDGNQGSVLTDLLLVRMTRCSSADNNAPHPPRKDVLAFFVSATQGTVGCTQPNPSPFAPFPRFPAYTTS